MNPKISVIVPVYKAEKYLHRCVDSILAQTFTDFEVLLIDDGSPDRSGEICDEYAEKDSRVRVFHKENRGVSSARNLAIDMAKGLWVTFVDSDDWISIEHLSSLLPHATYDAKLIINGANVSNEKGEISVYQSFNFKRYSILDEFDEILLFGGVCCKLYSLQVIKEQNLRFNESICNCEDCLFFWEYIEKAPEVLTVPTNGYFYYKEEDRKSLSNSIGIYSKWLRSFQLLSEEYDLLLQKIKISQEVDSSIKQFIHSLIFNAFKASYYNKVSRRKRLELYIILKNNLNKIKGNVNLISKKHTIMQRMPFLILDLCLNSYISFHNKR